MPFPKKVYYAVQESYVPFDCIFVLFRMRQSFTVGEKMDFFTKSFPTPRYVSTFEKSNFKIEIEENGVKYHQPVQR